MTGKSILITGCSSGIGLDTAIILKQRGYRVFASARKMEDVEKLKSLGLESLLLDVCDSASIQTAVDQILKITNGKLDALFNNAGFLQAGAVEDMTREMMRAQFETNVFGPMELITKILPVMRAQGHGRIIQNSSILGIVAMPFYGAYNASKFALEGFSRTLQQELRGTNIYVSIINPGPIVSHLRNNAYTYYQQTLAQKNSGAYVASYKKLEESYFKPSERDKKMALTPNAVAEQVIHALESSHPKVHYVIGNPAKLLRFLHTVLPDKTLDWVLSRLQ